MILFFLAPFWIAEAFAVWMMRLRPDGSPSPFESGAMLLSFVVLPAIAGAVVALRGGLHFARIAGGASICGAGFVVLALFEPYYEAYRFILGKTVLIALVPQGVMGWIGGFVVGIAAKRSNSISPPGRRIGALEGTGTGLVLMGGRRQPKVAWRHRDFLRSRGPRFRSRDARLRAARKVACELGSVPLPMGRGDWRGHRGPCRAVDA